MDKENKFWFAISSICIIGFLALVVICTINSAIKQDNIVRMVAAGTDPIKAACAIRGNESQSDMLYCSSFK